MRAVDTDLEEFMANPPKLAEVLATPFLYDAFYWFQVSRFAPENLLFREAVLHYKELVARGDQDKVPSTTVTTSLCPPFSFFFPLF